MSSETSEARAQYLEWRARSNPYVKRINEYPQRILLEREQQLAKIAEFVGREIYLEIGSGSGGHLIEQARRRVACTMFGIDLRYKRLCRTIEKAEAVGVSNLYLLRTDAREGVDLFPKGSISGIWINFPDPWPKRRGAKHRILSNAFIAVLSSIIRPGGFLYFKTDSLTYFDETLANLRNHPEFENVEMLYDLHGGETPADNVITEFERMFMRKGTKIAFARFYRCPDQLDSASMLK